MEWCPYHQGSLHSVPRLHKILVAQMSWMYILVLHHGYSKYYQTLSCVGGNNMTASSLITSRKSCVMVFQVLLL